MIELLRKEIRALRPMTLLTVAFFGALFTYGVATEFLDMPDSSSHADEGTGLLIFIGLFAAMTGANLLVSESNEGTLLFLDALPLSRTRIFCGKMCAGVAVLLLTPLLSLAMDLLSAAAEHQSTSEPVAWLAMGSWFVQQCLAAIYLLCVAAMLSFARKWFALVVGFVFWGFLWLRVNDVPWSGLFDPHQLIAYPDNGKGVHFPWRHAAAALGASAVSLGIAWLGFQTLGDGVQHATQRVRRWRFVSVLRFVGIALVPAVWIGAVVYFGNQFIGSPPPEVGSVKAAEGSFATGQTKRYDYVYREIQRKSAKELMAKADEIHDQVMTFLGASPVPGRIVADLGGAVMEHAAGQTNWTKIRVPLGLELPMHELEAVIGHETTHVYIEQLSNGAMMRQFDNARFFHEGLATFVEHKFFSTDEERQSMHRLAALAASRGKVPFPTLVSNDKLSKERDGTLAYPLGEVFCEALVATHGEEAPGKLLRAFARARAPAGLSGEALWRDAMQACGLSLDRVVAAYDAALDRAMTEEADFIATFPKLTAEVEAVGGEIVIRPKFEGEAPGKIVCMLQPGLDLKFFHAGEDGVIRLPRSQFPGPKLRYAIGWSSKQLRWPLFEKWTESGL